MIQVTNLSKIYHIDSVETVALSNISLQVKKGEFVAIIGPSGSGKSTLMHILGALDVPTSGKYVLDGQEVENLSDDQLARIRNHKIGFVFQAYNLLPRISSLKNVILPMVYGAVPKENRLDRAKDLLNLVGLSDRLSNTSSQLSGGQQQRVAIARALAMDPAIILADEPTGNLATVQSEEILHIFQRLNDEGRTIVIITHEQNIAAYAKRVVTLRDGKIISDAHQKQRRDKKVTNKK